VSATALGQTDTSSRHDQQGADMPEVPAGAKKPQDHKAAKAEAIDPDEPIEFEWRGQNYTIDPAFRDDVEILEDTEDEKYVNALRRVLGAEAWDEWKDANRDKDTGRVKATLAEEFMTDLFEVLGAGN